MKKIFILWAATFATLFIVKAQNIRISGEVTDTEQNGPAMYANVLLQTPDSIFVSGTSTGPDGKFQISNIAPGSYRLTISMVGYTTSITELEGLQKNINLGKLYLQPEAIALEGATVTASNIVNQADRKLIFPDQKQLESSTNGINLLQTMMLPRLSVNPVTNSISVAGGGQVQLRLNGVEVTEREITAIQPQEIIRIEFLENPGLRYGNAEIVLNYITRRNDFGGAGSIDLTNSPFIVFSNNQLSGRFNYKKSEFGLSYYMMARDFDEYWRDNEETFRFEDGSELHRYEIGLPGRLALQWHTIRANYNYKPSGNAFFNASLRYDYQKQPHNDFHSQLINSHLPDQVIVMDDKTKSHSKIPSLDLYYMHSLKNKQTLIFNVVGTYHESSNIRTYQEELNGTYLTDVTSDVSGKKYSVIGEAIYEKQMEAGRFSAGLKHTRSFSDNIYAGTMTYQTEMDQSDSYAYAEFQGKARKLTYTLGLGVSRSWQEQEGQEEYKNYIFRPRISLHYAFNQNFYVRLNGRIENIPPSLSELSAVTQLIDSLQIQKGNPDLTPYKQYRTDLYAEYKIGKITLSNYTTYVNQPKSIMGSVYRENGLFVHTFENQKRWQKLNTEFSLKTGLLWKVMQVSVTGGFSRSMSAGNTYKHTYNNGYYRGSLLAMYKKWMAAFEINSNRNDLFGEKVRGGENMHVLMIMYRMKNISVAAAMINPFVDNFKVISGNRNQYAYNDRTLYSNESSRAFILKFAWNFQFGRKYDAGQKRTDNRDQDSGIMNVGK